jgi:hypothetical protein
VLIKTSIDVSEGLKLCDLILKKMPYATNNALYRMANEVVEGERKELATKFKERTSFIPKRIQILKKPTAGDLWAKVGINTKVEGSRPLLTEFEEGGEKTPEHGPQIAVPLTGAPARPSFGEKVKRSLLYKNLGLKKGTGNIREGANHTYLIPGVGVFMRITERQRRRRGRGVQGPKLESGDFRSQDSVLIYGLKSQAPLRQRMHFVQTARELVLKRFAQIWNEEFVKELAGRAKRK